jgi:DNA repair and recombination protein RAD52
MFTEQQTKALKAPLSKANVKKNPRGFDYVEGWKAIEEANSIFGHDGWHRQTLEMRQLGEPEQVNGNWRVAYHCRVRVTVLCGEREIVRDGSGYGSGIVKDIRDAHESAIKEAETDAMKRALMTFGNPFGLALYDKTQANVIDAGEEAKAKYIQLTKAIIGTASIAADLGVWWNSEEQKQQRRDFELTNAEVDELKALVIARVDALKQKAAA